MATTWDSIWSKIAMKPPKKGATSSTSTFNPQSKDQVLSAPAYRDHLTSIYDTRQADDSRSLLKYMFRHDSDVSATVGAYLTLADTPMSVLVRNPQGEIDPDATKSMMSVLNAFQHSTDYTQGFEFKRSIRTYNQEFRYMLMLRGAIGAELVLDKMLVPTRVHNIDMVEVEWFEKESGVYKPQQKPPGSSDIIKLDIPTFFVAYHRRDPTTIYPMSDFVSAINTIAARQQVINDLYRIMQLTGFPRMDVKVVEEVILKAAPPGIKNDPVALKVWMNDRLTEVMNKLSGIRADQPFGHWDSVEIKMMNEKAPGAALDVSKVIETLNAANQAALKTMAVVIGRGDGGGQVASTEARIAAMNADQLNVPLADMWSRMFTFMLNLSGKPGLVEVRFEAAEMRPWLELETQRTLQDARLREDLSHGLITDEEYHLAVHKRLPPDGIKPMSGTGFMAPMPAASVDAKDVSPNGDPLGRSMVPEGAKNARSNQSKGKDSAKAALLEAGVSEEEADAALALVRWPTDLVTDGQ
jgi:hypothetical protein